MDPLLKEVGDLVTTALLTSAFSVCLGFPVEFCSPLLSASEPSSRVFRDKELAVVEEDQVTELLSQLDMWKSRVLDRMHQNADNADTSYCEAALCHLSETVVFKFAMTGKRHSSLGRSRKRIQVDK